MLWHALLERCFARRQGGEYLGVDSNIQSLETSLSKVLDFPIRAFSFYCQALKNRHFSRFSQTNPFPLVLFRIYFKILLPRCCTWKTRHACCTLIRQR